MYVLNIKKGCTINHPQIGELKGAVGAVVEADDKIGFILNLETDTSEVDDIIVSDGSIYYNTTHIGTESTDV